VKRSRPGFELVEEFDLFKENYFVVFKKK